MAYFECTIGGASGDGVALIVQCDANFAGSTITADNGEDIFTETCPSVSPYTVRFEGIPTGTYTISGVSQGQTFTTQFTVLDYETTLNATPEGATVLPINDVQIWLHCANIFDKNYTTISEVLADNTSLITLISSNNAVDYMVRSTGFATEVCANQTAMGYIGNNDYCADTLLADATWCEAICNSDYFESVLTTKVPTMTSNTVPSGKCYCDGYSAYNANYAPWKAFDGISTTGWMWNTGGVNHYIGYQFANPIKIYKAYIKGNTVDSTTVTIKATNDNISTDEHSAITNSPTWQTIKSVSGISTLNGANIILNGNTTAYTGYKIDNLNSTNMDIATLQFYGRA